MIMITKQLEEMNILLNIHMRLKDKRIRFNVVVADYSSCLISISSASFHLALDNEQIVFLD